MSEQINPRFRELCQLKHECDRELSIILASAGPIAIFARRLWTNDAAKLGMIRSGDKGNDALDTFEESLRAGAQILKDARASLVKIAETLADAVCDCDGADDADIALCNAFFDVANGRVEMEPPG
jgi:hypothetical protein